MFDDEEEDNGFFLLVLGVLAAILVIVTVVARSGDDLPEATVTGDSTTTTAAPETTTTAAPAPTTTEAAAAAPETTTTAAPEPTNIWQSLNDSGQAGQFALIGGALGLQESLEGTDPPQRTLFAPSDAALAQLDPSVIPGLQDDPAAASALVGYHILPDNLAAADLIALDGQQIESSTGLPINVTVVDGAVVLNGTTTVVDTDFTADNGVVHIIDTVLTPPTINSLIGLENIEFEVSSAVITAAGQEELQRAVTFFNENPDVGAVIEGHTDTDGSEEGNLTLSQNRAESVLAFLVDNGIDADRLSAVGFGEAQPILDAAGVEDKPASRRIEFQVR